MLIDQAFVDRGFSCTTRTNDCHAANLRHSQVHVHNRRIYWKSTQVMRRTTLLRLLTSSRRPGSKKTNFYRPVAQLELRLQLWVLFHENSDDIGLNSFERLRLPILLPPDINHVQETRGLNKHEHIAVHQLSRAQVHLHLSRHQSRSSRATPSLPRGPGQSDLPKQTRAALGRPDPPLILLLQSTLSISNITFVMYFPTIIMFTRASVRKTV